MIAIVDYKAGNLTSVKRALEFLGHECEITDRAERIVAAFKNEVLDQDLRSIIAKETEATRNAVLAFALSKTGLQGGD